MRFQTIQNRRFVWLTLFLFLLEGATLMAAVRGPLEVIQSGTDRALQIIRKKDAGGKPNLRAQRAEILEIVEEYFNFYEMARRALGRPWKDQTPENQREFVKLFKELLFNNYVDRVESYTGSDESFIYDQPRIDGEYALIKSRVTGYKNTEVAVEYRLRFVDGQWKVYDLVLEGISLVNNYRSQFSSILAKDSFDELLQQLRKKVVQQQKSR